jgi:hypothetical protein
MNSDDKIIKILEDLQADVLSIKEVQQVQGKDIAALKSDVGKIPAIEKQLEQQGKLLSVVMNNTATLLEEHSAQRMDIRSLHTDVGSLHEEVHASHEKLKAEIRAARAEAKMDNVELKAQVLKKNQSHERRITNIEDQSGIENPEKH